MKEGMTLKENKEGHMGGFGRREEKEEREEGNDVIVISKLKRNIFKIKIIVIFYPQSGEESGRTHVSEACSRSCVLGPNLLSLFLHRPRK